MIKMPLNIKKSDFVKSGTKPIHYPEDIYPEFFFAGKSNAGKSSMLNKICNRRKLAITSKTPGRTQNIKLFLINEKINVIDLPGYGYAKISKIKREELATLVENYLINRENLKQVFVLIDCKVGIKDSDIDILDKISESNKKFSIVLTKIDKCAVNFVKEQSESLLSFLKNYESQFNKIFSTSGSKNIGIIDIQKEIFNLSKKS